MKHFIFTSLILYLKIFHLQTWADGSFAEETLNSGALVNESCVNAAKKDEGKAVQSVLMVCSENQCRSPIAAAVFRELAERRGVGDKWRCDSAGIYVYHPEARWQMDKRAKACLRNHRIFNLTHIARMVEEKDFSEFDYMLGMDEANVEDLKEKAPAGSRTKIELLSSYDPQGSALIENPFYDRDRKGFEECYKIAARSCKAFLDRHS